MLDCLRLHTQLYCESLSMPDLVLQLHGMHEKCVSGSIAVRLGHVLRGAKYMRKTAIVVKHSPSGNGSFHTIISVSLSLPPLLA